MPNALIYSPDFDGHRQVYVFVMANVLLELGFRVFIAGDTKHIISNSFYIDKLKDFKDINIIDTSKYPYGGNAISSTEFLNLQNACQTDLTIFAEADMHIPLFVSQLFKRKNRFRGKLAGIFLRPFYFYDQPGLIDKLRYLKHLPARWKSDERLFHGFLLKRFSLINVPLYIDEIFVDHHPSTVWLPDMFQQYAELLVKDERSDQRSWIKKLDEFKEKNSGRFLFFYFGTAQLRRGYDTLIKMANDNGDCFIHCGLRNDKEKFVYDVDILRSTLRKDGRLFETNQYITDPVCIEYFFRSVSHLILPYRNFFGSSGVMLQALSFDIPILAPENGIIGHRIKKYRLGLTYNNKMTSSLEVQFSNFRKLDPEDFRENIKTYMNFQSTDQLKKVLVNSFRVSN